MRLDEEVAEEVNRTEILKQQQMAELHSMKMRLPTSLISAVEVIDDMNILSKNVHLHNP